MASTTLPSYEHVTTSESAAPEYQPRDDAIAIVPNFPSDLVFYRTEFPHMVIGTATSPDSTLSHMIPYVSIHLRKQTKGASSNLAIQIRSTPSSTSTVIADIKFNVTPSTDLTIYRAPLLGPASVATHYKLSHTGVMTSDVHTFTLPRRGGSGAEKFEWHHSGAEAVKVLATRNVLGEDFSQNDRGLKLIRANDQSKEIIAVYSGGTRSGPLNPRKITGKLSFLQASGDAEDNFENFRLVVVMSVLSMMERGRVQTMRNSEWFCLVS